MRFKDIFLNDCLKACTIFLKNHNTINTSYKNNKWYYCNIFRATLPVQDTETNIKCDVHHKRSSSPTVTHAEAALNGSPRRHSSVDEIFGLFNSMNVNGQRQRSLSDSGRTEHNNINGRQSK